MKAVFDALYTKFTGSALSTAIGGRYFPIEAPVGTLVPYVVGSIISEVSDCQASNNFVNVLLELSVVATDIATMHSVSELVSSLFDKAALTVSGYQQVGVLERYSGQPLVEDEVFRYIIEYRLELRKA